MTLPKTMRCIEISAPGGPEVLVVGERPLPVAGNGEVLIKVAAAGVNRADTSQRKGNYPVPPGAPDILGMEVSGTVVAVGAGVTRWKAGDALCALVAGGGYAEYCAAPAANCMPIPKGLTVIEGGALPETFMTVWSNVWDRAQLAPGESVLIQGGSSGIGVTAIQVAKALGHTVYATAGSAEKCAACEKLGADRAINYKTEDFVAVVKELTGGKGVNVVLDMVAGSYVQRELECLALDGRLLVFPSDELKLQSNGGKGLTLMDVDTKTPLVSVATFSQALLVTGLGRGDKPKEEQLKGASLAPHLGKRARKGAKVDGFKKPQRVLAA